MIPSAAQAMSNFYNDVSKSTALLEDAGMGKPGKSKALLAMVKEAIKVIREHDWKPVSKGLPKKEDFYLVTIETTMGSRFVEIRYFYKLSGFACPADCKVVAWMPEPKPMEG